MKTLLIATYNMYFTICLLDHWVSLAAHGWRNKEIKIWSKREKKYSPHDKAVDVVITIHMAKLEIPEHLKRK